MSSMMFSAPKPKTSKIGSAYTRNVSSTMKKLPTRLGGTNDPTFKPQQTALPTATGINSPATSVVQSDTIKTPDAPADIWQPTGTEGIDRWGKAATAETEIRVNNKRRQDAEAQQAQFQSGLDAAGNSLDFSGTGGVAGLDGEQMENARLIAQFGKERGMSEQDIQIAIMTAMTESSLRNIAHGDRDSVGLFQQRTSQGWGTVGQIMDPRYSAGKFYDGLRGAQGRTPWERAQAVQRSAFADGSNYQQHWGTAQQAYQAIQGASTSPTMKPNGSMTWINSNNLRYHDFDGQWGAQCVDLYNFYMTGFVGGRSSVGEVNYAQELWSRHDTGALVQIARNQKPRMGDIAIWSNAMNGMGGHVAIVAQDNGNGTIRVLNANATSAGSRGVTTMSNLSTGTLLGYLRPRKLM